ncbi:alpha/beta fold hydrolase [Candidatus Roizmanbacteria bacterium]|nr:alpha/beta fold hydrolase [Candidatus Roizmanbacteria bacterium]
MALDYYTDNREYVLKGNSSAVLLIHGFGCTPSEMRGLALHLHAKGYTVSAICLPGHGTTSQALQNITSIQWVQYAQQKLDELKAYSHDVSVVGRSLGSLIALQLAAQNELKAVITMSPPLYPRIYVYSIQLLNIVKKYVTVVKGCTNNLYLKTANAPPYTVQYYPRVPVHSVVEILRAAIRAKKILKIITTPILIIHGVHDKMVKKKYAKKLFNGVSSPIKKLIFLPHSYHNPTVESEREFVWKTIGEFIDSTKV